MIQRGRFLTQYAMSVLIVVCALSIISCKGWTQSSQEYTPRSIGVCLLNDASYPVNTAAVEEGINQVFRNVKTHVQILKFGIVERHLFTGDLDLFHTDLAIALWRVCSPDSRIILVLSNSRRKNGEIKVSYTTDSESVADPGSEDLDTGAIVDRDFGYIIHFEAEENYRLTGPEGEPLLIGMLSHEIGHLFGIEHTNDPQSFMFWRMTLSERKWTPEVIHAFREKAFTTHWFIKSRSRL